MAGGCRRVETTANGPGSGRRSLQAALVLLLGLWFGMTPAAADTLLAHADRAFVEQASRDFDLAQSRADPVAAARALLQMAQHYRARGLWLQMEEVCNRARRLLVNSVVPADVQVDLDLAWASAVQQQGRADEAFAPMASALERARAMGDGVREARALVGLSSVHGRSGNLAEAERQADLALAAARKAGNAEWQARALINLSLIAREHKDEPRAYQRIQDALALPLNDEASDVQQQLLVAQASILRVAGDPARALQVAREAETRARASGNSFLLGYALHNQASALCDSGDQRAASAAFAQALEQYPEEHNPLDASRIQLAWADCLARGLDFAAAFARQKHGAELQAKAAEQRRVEVLEALNYAYQDQARQKELAEAHSERERLQAELSDHRARIVSAGLLVLLLLAITIGVLLRSRVLRSEKLAAEAAQAARSDLLAVAGHEIRNPTQGLLSALAALRGAQLSPSQQRALETATHAAEVIARLSSDAFELALSERRPLTPRRRWVEANTVLQDALALIRPAASARGLTLRVDDDSGGRRVDVDPERLLQALVNLLTNAVRYTERGSVSVQSRFVDEPATRWEITISDSGPGIPAADLPHIFDPYFRGTQGARSHGGGLGLAVVGRVVAAHGGSISASNRPDGGASFCITLPLGGPGPVSDPPAAADGATALSNCRLLLVDDDEDVRLGVAAMLELAGAHVVVAADSVDALTQLRAFDPEVVLIDLNLGNERGDQVLKILKGAGGERVRRWVLATGSVSSDRNDYGFDVVLLKPFGIADLVAAIGGSRG